MHYEHCTIVTNHREARRRGVHKTADFIIQKVDREHGQGRHSTADVKTGKHRAYKQ